MAEKSRYNYRVEPQDVDFTRGRQSLRWAARYSTPRASTPTARVRSRCAECRQPFVGAFAHGRRIRLPAHAVHRLHRGYVDQRLRPGALDAKLHADRCRRPRIRPRRDAVGDDRPAEPFGDRPLVGGRCACRRHRRCRAPDGQAAQDPCGKPLPRRPNTAWFTATSTSTATSTRCAISK